MLRSGNGGAFSRPDEGVGQAALALCGATRPLDPAGLSAESGRRMVRRLRKAPRRGKRIPPGTARAIELVDFLHECAQGQRKATDAQVERAIRELEKLVPEG